MSRLMTKPTKWHMRPAKTPICLGIRPVWSESSLSAWRKLGSLATHWAHSEDSDQTGRMPRLIWVVAGRTVILLLFSCGGSYVVLRVFHASAHLIYREENVVVVVVCSGFTSLSTFFSHVTTVSGCDRSSTLTFVVLSHWSIMPQTLDMILYPVSSCGMGGLCFYCCCFVCLFVCFFVCCCCFNLVYPIFLF